MTRTTILFPLALACSEYGLHDKANAADEADSGDAIADTGDPAVTTPGASVSPDAVSLGAVCDDGAQEVTVTSAGDAPLVVHSAVASGGTWTLAPVGLPQTLAPGETLTLRVVGLGPGELVIETDAADTPTLTVPLSATADEAPSLALVSPADGSVLSPGTVATITFQLTDDHDRPETLTVGLESDIDGHVASATPNADGSVEFSWDAAAQSSGPHTLTASVFDSCEARANAALTVCQNQGYVEDSIDLATWNFEGAALWNATDNWVQLTDPGTDQAGTAFQTSTTVDASNVVIEFSFYVSGGSGADGISLTALDSARMTSFVGATGGGIGYAGLPGWSIEVDTYYNGASVEPTPDDHVSVHIDGAYTSYVAAATLPEMEDNAWHDMAVTVSGTWLTVAIDGTTYLDQDVPQLTSFPAYVGFTGATGSLTNWHLIDALAVERFVCEE